MVCRYCLGSSKNGSAGNLQTGPSWRWVGGRGPWPPVRPSGPSGAVSRCTRSNRGRHLGKHLHASKPRSMRGSSNAVSAAIKVRTRSGNRRLNSRARTPPHDWPSTSTRARSRASSTAVMGGNDALLLRYLPDGSPHGWLALLAMVLGILVGLTRVGPGRLSQPTRVSLS